MIRLIINKDSKVDRFGYVFFILSLLYITNTTNQVKYRKQLKFWIKLKYKNKNVDFSYQWVNLKQNFYKISIDQ